MREWKLGPGDPLHLVLAADARLGVPRYTDDHIWDLALGGGEPPALLLHTTFGLRAGWMRLFPRFVRAGGALTDPAAFAQPPRLVHFAPNYACLTFSPFSGIDVRCEYRVPDSCTITGRLRIHNNSVLKETLRLEWVGLLSPLEQGEAMAARPAAPTPVLAGSTEGLYPVCAVSGAAVMPASSPFPALAVEWELYPGNDRELCWALASLDDPAASLAAARSLAAEPWEPALARITMLERQHIVEITTGEPDWDAALAFTQVAALRLFLPGPGLPHPSFVHARGSDRGYSPRGDGSDYPYPWSGQTVLGAWHMAGLLPGAPELARGLLLNFLHTQQEDGFVDWKPGLGGQRGKYLAPPLLASLAWKLGQADPDPGWLAVLYPMLWRFLNLWMDTSHDRDQDGYPEWDHPLQTGYENNPLFDRWHIQSQGVDITTLESPALGAMLYRECDSLARIARRANLREDLPVLEMWAARLRAVVEQTWDPGASIYRFRDYQTHTSQPGRLVKTFQGSGAYPAGVDFNAPQRLILRVHNQEENTRAARVILHGLGPQGELREELRPLQFFWMHGEGRATTQSVFTRLNAVEIDGLESRDRLRIYTVDYTQEAVSLLLPLWAGIPGEARAWQTVERALLGRYLAPWGIPMCPAGNAPDAPTTLSAVEMVWNTLVGEGLLRYGRQAEAAGLVTRLMSTVVQSLKIRRAFGQSYNAYTGQASGDSNSLFGLAPLGLFLQTAGIERLAANEVILRGINPFPWPITVQYRGITVTRQGEETQVTFPTGKPVAVRGPGPYRLSLT